MVVCKTPQIQASSGILESAKDTRGGQGLLHATAWRTPIQTSHGRRYRQFCANQELPVPRRFSLSSQPLLSQSVSIFTLSTHYTSTLSTPFLGISKNEETMLFHCSWWFPLNLPLQRAALGCSEEHLPAPLNISTMACPLWPKPSKFFFFSFQ